MKKCNKCNQEKPLDSFPNDGKKKRPRCRDCFNEARRVPEGHALKSTSTCFGPDGKILKQWVKTETEKKESLAALREAVKDIAAPFKGKSVKPKTPKKRNPDLLCVYPMGDPHLGMYASAAETGEEFNLNKAERNLINAVDMLVDVAPHADEALIINLGDFFHTDNSSNMTNKSKNPLDVDGRWNDLLKVGVRAMRRIIDRTLEKHKKVTVINEIGNHDDHSAQMLGLCLEMYYDNNPRVTVDTSPDHFHWYRFGKNLIGVTHGHGPKPADLGPIMAVDRKEDWGQTDHRFWYTGHIHHDTVKEYRGCIVETFRTLASRDAWHHNQGYRSGRDMKCDVLHKDWGRINRHIIGIQQICHADKK